MPPKRKAKEALSPGGPMGFARQTTKGNTKGKGKAREATVDLVGDDEDDYQPQPQSQPKKDPPKKTTRRPAAKRARKDSSPDIGLDMGSAPKRNTIEQHLMDQAKKSKEYQQGFRGFVGERQQQALGNLEQLKEDLLKSQESNQDDLKALFRTFGDEDDKPTDLKENPLYQMTEKLYGIAQAVMERHRAIEKEVAEQAKKLATPREEWTRDAEQLRQVIQYGKYYGQKLVKDMVRLDGEDGDDSEGEDQGRELTQVEEIGRGIFKRSVKAVAKRGAWGQISHTQVKALSDAIRVISKGMQSE